jgi:adenine deaminase
MTTTSGPPPGSPISASLHSLEVLEAATHNSAQTLREPHLGLVRPGYLADLIIVDGNPAENFRHMYAFGAIRMNDRGQIHRTRGIVHTIKDGVVVENAKLMEAVARMVAESKRGAKPLITETPFLIGPGPVKTSGGQQR